VVRAADVPSREAPSLEQPPDIWRIMADRVTQSWSSVPQFYVTRDVDGAALVDLRRRLGSSGEAGASGVTYTDLLVALVARALMRHARLNASWTAGGIRHHDAANVGIATALEQGVVVPVVHGADRLSVLDIAQRRRELIDRARAGRLRPADLAGGTFTISNLGTHEVQAFSAIVNAPQAAILAVGRIADRVVAREGQPAVRPLMTLTLTCDHRVADGARAAVFLNDVARSIEHPEDLLP
jgi:pyruvate dehydrogenase E2 component (dihydrolipoamide acetyltransferase)